LNRAVALAQLAGPSVALCEVDTLGSELDGYHLFHAVRAELLNAQGRHVEAQAAERRALELTHNPAEQSLLRRRLAVDAC
jgi:RNA polymerase sigma-70 factor (ECF subfamily)